MSRSKHNLLLIGLIIINYWLRLATVANAQINSESVPTKTELTQQLPPPVVPVPIKIGAPPLSVGLILNGKSVLDGINVRGSEDGEKEIDFERWLIPFDEAMKALGIRVKEIGKGETVELSSASFRVNFDPRKLQDDPVLGRSIAIADLQSIGGIKAKFDLYKYAIAITIPQRANASISSDNPIDLDGLPMISADKFGMGAIQQRSNVSGASSGNTRTSGELRAIGNIGTGSWQVRIDQPTLGGINKWNLNSANILFQGKATDLAIGSQQPFWGQSFGQGGFYWRVTTISRSGFVPPVSTTGSDFSVSDRLQSSRVGRSIIGQAALGTVVQLVRSLNTEVVKEVLVDSSGTFRFENIIVGSVGEDVLGRDYRLLLYPRGQLTASPEIRDVQFTTLLGQLPSGSSAWVASVGGNRITSGQFGNFDAIKGGVLYRRGLNESLTVGIGSIYDEGVRGVGEVLFQPTGVPLEVAGSIITGTNPIVLGRLNYQPSPQFNLTANVDRLSVRSDANWRLSPGFAAIASYDTQSGSKVGGEFSARDRRNATSLRATIDNLTRLNWTARQTQGEIKGTDRSIEDLSGFGQVKIVPFFDRNGNGHQDAGEEGYADPLLLEINRKPLRNYHARTNGLVSSLQLAPGSYRLDLNPAGYPISHRGKAAALQIDVIAGTTTEIPVPLIPAYAMTGVVKNSAGESIVGGRVEAISLANGEKYTSVTNDSGIYYLEGLEQIESVLHPRPIQY